jgi:archaetidylinositol phosphate synthase
MVVGIIGLIFPVTIYGLTLLGWLMVLFGVFGHITAFQRAAYVWAKVE